jgi:type 1 glutamine amidotransferase
MKKITTVLLIIFCISFTKKTSKVLIFAKTKSFHHNSIAKGIPAIIQLGKENNFIVDTTTDATLFTIDNLKQYKAVIFLSTTGDVLNDEQQAAFQQYIENGGGYVGIHAATDCEHKWAWYNTLTGAYFKNHPKQQQATLHVIDSTFIATKNLPTTWQHYDEWYNFKSTQFDQVHILLTVDEKSYTGGENGDIHPISWYHTVGKGKSFYTALGHTDDCYTDKLFLQHVLGGIQYAMNGKTK